MQVPVLGTLYERNMLLANMRNRTALMRIMTNSIGCAILRVLASLLLPVIPVSCPAWLLSCMRCHMSICFSSS